MPSRLLLQQANAGPAGMLLVALAGITAAATLAARLGPFVGTALLLLVTALAARLMLSRQVEVYPAAASVSDLGPLLDKEAERRQHARWFVHMRWIAIVISFGLILASVPVAHLLPRRAGLLLGAWWLVLLAANVVFRRWALRGRRFERQIVVQGVVDLIVLTGFINASGGIENPVYFAYLFHVIIAGILLPKPKAFALTLTAALLFLAMAVGEYFHLLPHFTNRVFPHLSGSVTPHEHGAEPAAGEPVHATPAGGHEHPGEAASHAAHDPVYVLGHTLPFLTLLLLSAYLTSLIAQRLRTSEAQLEGAAETLMLEHQRLERIVESAGAGMMLVDPDLTVPWSSRRAGRWLGLSGEARGRSCPLYHAEEGCADCIAETSLRTGASLESEREVRSERGGVRYFRHATAPVLDSEGRTVQVVELLEEVTDRKALEAEALHAGKLSALGQMAAGVAHEIGNPLSSLATRLDLLERRPEPEYVKESVGLLRGQIERIRRIVHGISLFARSRTQEWAVWDLNGVVRETLEMARLDRRGQQMRFVTRFAEPSPWVRGVKDQITQVLLNLLLNAAEASASGSEISIQTTEGHGWTRCAVRDAGAGLSPEARQRLFEPFFSTKEKGTGLGLSICYSLVNAHGGRIEVDSEEGHGSTFTVVLPTAASSEGGRSREDR